VDTVRTFIAIEISQEARVRVVEHINHLRREVPNVRASWSREDNLHLTLKFLGNVPVSQISAVSQAAAAAAAAIEPFELTIGGCGWFPPHGKPKVLWIGIDDPDSRLRELQDALQARCAEAGFQRDERAFHPHLTIARLRSPAGSRHLAETHKAHGFPSQRLTVSELVVFRSELLRDGSKHTAISRHDLGGG
jgi:2'-5' RNA ligase